MNRKTFEKYGFDERAIEELEKLGYNNFDEKDCSVFFIEELSEYNYAKKTKKEDILFPKIFKAFKDFAYILNLYKNGNLTEDVQYKLLYDGKIKNGSKSSSVDYRVCEGLAHIFSHKVIIDVLTRELDEYRLFAHNKDEIISVLSTEEKVSILKQAKTQILKNSFVRFLNLFTPEELVSKPFEPILHHIYTNDCFDYYFAACLKKDLLETFLLAYPQKFSTKCLVDIIGEVGENIVDYIFEILKHRDDLIQNFRSRGVRAISLKFYKPGFEKFYQYYCENRKAFIDECAAKGFDYIIDRALKDRFKDGTTENKVDMMSEIFAERFAFDSVKNLTLNLQTVYDYMNLDSNYKNKIGENADIIKTAYLLFEDLDNLRLDYEKKLNDFENVYKSFKEKDVDLEKILYSCLTVGKETFMQEIVEKETKFNKLKYKECSIKTHDDKEIKYKLHEFKGEDFTFLIHCTNFGRYYFASDCVNYKDEWLKKADKGNVLSLSLVNNLRMDNYERDASIIFAFLNLNPKLLLHACLADSFSCSNEENLKTQAVSETKMDLEPIENFIKDMDDSFNELVYAGDKKHTNQPLMPSAVVCFEKPTEYDIKAARDFDIPVIYVDKNKYFNPYSKSKRIPGQFQYDYL